MSEFSPSVEEHTAVAERLSTPSGEVCGSERHFARDSDICARIEGHRGNHMTESYLNFLTKTIDEEGIQ